MDIKSAKFLQSTPTLKGCPSPEKPEFAFIGRSNVGKSSLINMLVQRKSLALTSSNPGKTKAINHFEINDSWYLVDLPGYGYAKISQKERNSWMVNLQEYLTKRENLLNIFILIDANIPPQNSDLTFCDWLGENSLPFCIVFTKSDKSKQHQLQLNLTEFHKSMGVTWEEMPPYIVTSVDKKLGRDELLDYIQAIIATW